MKQRRLQFMRLALLAVLAAGWMGFSLQPAEAQSQAQRKKTAAAQFERAERMRTALNGKPARQRTAREYLQLVNTFRRVYLITPHAAEVPAALLAVAETYQEMGRQFDPKHFQSAIDAYQFLLHEYPTNRYRMDALFTIAQIQQEDLGQPQAARLTYEEYIRRFPRSPRADQAKRALADITAAREQQKKDDALAQQTAERVERSARMPQVTNIRHWNAENSTRVVVDVEDAIQWTGQRIPNPDRIFFDIYKARLSSPLSGKTIEVGSGFLKNVRVAQNQAGVVRVVLEVDQVKDYTVMVLPDPYRLVIDVYGHAPVSRASAQPPAGVASKKVETAENRTPPKKETSRAESAPPKAPSSATPKSDGNWSLTRAMGLKVRRIVIDAGHGGHDTGTIGPTGLMEKDLCLDIALRLGKMINGQMPGVEVHYTRTDDTFIPLEERAPFANKLGADLFISIHANSSPRDRNARGVETYYLSLTTSQEAMEVAARENSMSQSSMNEVQSLLQRIARNEKVEESRELAAAVQQGLAARMARYSRYVRNRGVKKAPFIVLVGTDMPAILTEVSFISNPQDERVLKTSAHRNRVVEGLYKGVENYVTAIGTVAVSQARAEKNPE